MKYNGTGSFSHKLDIFYDVCNRVGFPKDDLKRTLPIMLTGFAQSVYYNRKLGQRTFEEARAELQEYFEGPTAQRSNLNT
jgi:hypothetical protein